MKSSAAAFANGTPGSVLLLLARLMGAAALLLAGVLKVKGGPLPFALAIDSFKLFPAWSHVPMAYFVPWFEIVIGTTLVLGIWARQSALLATGLLGSFTLALATVLARDLKVDCGCFSGLFGEAQVSWFSIARNSTFLVATIAVLVLGPGRFAVQPEKPDEPAAP